MRNTWPGSRKPAGRTAPKAKGYGPSRSTGTCVGSRSQDMEQEFKAVANAIRQDKGLGPALEGLAVA